MRTAAGDIDVAFWRRIYNPQDAYGGELITGWITRLYPYVEGRGALDVPNPMLELPLDEPRNLTTAQNRGYAGPGLRSGSIPATVSSVRVHLDYEGTNETHTVAVAAGVVAVQQDHEGALRPIAGWRVEPASPLIDEIVERIVRDHHAVPAATPEGHRMPLEGPADVVALFSRLETATLFTGDRQWTLCGPRDQRSVSFERSGEYNIKRIADISGGRSLCFATSFRAWTHWITCRLQTSDDREIGGFVLLGSVAPIEPPEQIRVLRGSLASILEHALETNGDIDALEIGRFDELLRPGPSRSA